jgi:DNA-binding MarR family transcriptional regulator/DNA-binding CsgD family transcriptional regulator
MLEALGISDTEQAVYELMVTLPPVTTAELAAHAGISPASLPELLRRLEQLGLVARLPDDPPRLAVVPVAAATDALIAAGERSLAAARQRITQLAERFDRSYAGGDPLSPIEVVRGRSAVQARLDELTRNARTEMRGFDAPPYLNDPDAPSRFEVEGLRKGVRYRVIYDWQAIGRPGRLPDIDHTIERGEEARVARVPMKLGLSDHSMAMLPLRNDPVDVECWLVVHDSVLLDALSALFETYWERAVPLHIARGRPDLVNADGPNEVERVLLPLLFAGLTDKAIAAHLGWHERTAHRHLRSMLARLDAETRFQAGYQAVRRGWLKKSP